MIIIRVLISIVFYLILMKFGVNLLGLFVRGLFIYPDIDKLKTETKLDFLKKEIEKSERADK